MIETLDKTHYPCRTGTFAISTHRAPITARKIQARDYSTWPWHTATLGEHAFADLESVLSSVAPPSGRFCRAPFLRCPRPSPAEHECSRLGWFAGVRGCPVGSALARLRWSLTGRSMSGSCWAVARFGEPRPGPAALTVVGI